MRDSIIWGTAAVVVALTLVVAVAVVPVDDSSVLLKML